MAKIAFNDLTIKNLEPPAKGQKTYWCKDLSGFGIRLSQGGSKTWIVLDPRSQIRTQETIGRYPLVSLKMARSEARTRLAQSSLKKPSLRVTTWEKATETYLAEIGRKRKARTHADYSRLLGKFKFASTKLHEITQDNLQKKLDRMKDTPAEYTHAFVVLRAFFNWAYQNRHIEEHPLARLKVDAYNKRSRVLTDNELKKVWKSASGTYGSIVKLLILTGQRVGEISSLEPSMIEKGKITLPETLTKNGIEHSFPIGKMTAKLVRPYRWKGWSKSKARLDKASGVTGWRLHDLRRTFRTKWAQLGISAEVAERYINHISGVHAGIRGIYDRHTYWPEMKAAVEKWERYIQSHVA